MDGVIAFLRPSDLVKVLGLALLALLGFNLVDTGRGMLVFWMLVAAAITVAGFWAAHTTSGAARLTCATLASYAIGVVWLVYQWPSPLLVWAVITSLLVTAGLVSFRSKSDPAVVVCIVLAITLPQALFAAVFEQFWSKSWTMF